MCSHMFVLLLNKSKIKENIFEKKNNTFGDPEIMSCLIELKWKHLIFLKLISLMTHIMTQFLEYLIR